jgi:hypothetical protein
MYFSALICLHAMSFRIEPYHPHFDRQIVALQPGCFGIRSSEVVTFDVSGGVLNEENTFAQPVCNTYRYVRERERERERDNQRVTFTEDIPAPTSWYFETFPAKLKQKAREGQSCRHYTMHGSNGCTTIFRHQIFNPQVKIKPICE